MLLDYGVTVDTGCDALHFAASYGTICILQQLVERGAALDEFGNFMMYCGTTPLHGAVYAYQVEAARLSLEFVPDVDAYDADEVTTLRIEVDFILDSYSVDLCMAEVLIAAGADMVKCGAVQEAAKWCHIGLLEFTLRAGADFDAKVNDCSRCKMI